MPPRPDIFADLHAFSGAPIYLLHPEKTEIHAYDLFHHSRGVMRYNGAPPVSVLRHSFLVALLAWFAYRDQKDVVAECAAHDLSECYLGEVTKGLKRLMGVYMDLERVWEPRVRRAVGLEPEQTDEMHKLVKIYDIRALVLELRWHQHPVLDIVSDKRPTTWRERIIQAVALARYPGGDRLAWWALTRWLPRLRERGAL